MQFRELNFDRMNRMDRMKRINSALPGLFRILFILFILSNILAGFLAFTRRFSHGTQNPKNLP
jgi:hypothetical protein